MSSRLRLPRQQLEEDLRKSEEKFSKAFRESPMALALTSTKDNRYIEVNDTFEHLTGWRRDEVIGRTPYDIGVFVEPSQRSDIVQRLVSGETIRNVEFEIRTKNGEVRTNLGSAELIEINGEPCIFAVAADITDLKRAEESRWRYTAIVESSHDAIIARNLEGVISAWNASAQRMFGYTEKEAIGQPITIIIPPELHDQDRDILRRLRAGERIDSYETVRVTKAGTRVDVSVTISPLRDSAGRIVEFFAIARDITGRKQAEAALRESEAQFRLVVNTAPVLLWMSGVDKLCTFVNDGWLEFTGRSLEEELESGWAQDVHPDDVEICLETYATAFDRREPFLMEYRVRRRDGEYRWVLDQGVPRFNADTSFAGYIGSCVDVTERKLAEEALSTVSQKLIEAHEEERTRLARELHDDVIQRLTVLSTNLQLVKQSPPASTAELGQEIGAVIQEIAELFTDIRAMSHRLHSSKLELLGLAAAAAGFCEELSNRHGVQIDFHIENVPTGLPPDISLCLYRVLQEALQNAVKHSGSRQAHVSLHGGVNHINLAVKDSGLGFDPHEAMRGRGLGLTSMKERLKLVGGQLSIHSERGRGTVIHALVPLRLP